MQEKREQLETLNDRYQDTYDILPKLRGAPEIDDWNGFRVWLESKSADRVVGTYGRHGHPPLAQWLYDCAIKGYWVVETRFAVVMALDFCARQSSGGLRPDDWLHFKFSLEIEQFQTVAFALHKGDVTAQQCLNIVHTINVLREIGK